jgi:hypothetical protein
MRVFVLWTMMLSRTWKINQKGRSNKWIIKKRTIWRWGCYYDHSIDEIRKERFFHRLFLLVQSERTLNSELDDVILWYEFSLLVSDNAEFLLNLMEFMAEATINQKKNTFPGHIVNSIHLYFVTNFLIVFDWKCV